MLSAWTLTGTIVNNWCTLLLIRLINTIANKINVCYWYHCQSTQLSTRSTHACYWFRCQWMLSLMMKMLVVNIHFSACCCFQIFCFSSLWTLMKSMLKQCQHQGLYLYSWYMISLFTEQNFEQKKNNNFLKVIIMPKGSSNFSHYINACLPQV